MTEREQPSECAAVQPELGAYLDGELSLEERAAIDRHLEGCVACGEELSLLRLIMQSLSRAPRPEPSQAMRQRLLTQVMAELPPHRVMLISMERYGDQVLQRREVRLTREPALPPPAAPLVGPALSLIVQKHRQEAGYQGYCYRLVESRTGRNHHE